MGYRIAKRGRYWWLFGRVKGTRLDSSLRTTVKSEAEAIAKEKVRRVLERAHGVRVIHNAKFGVLLDKYLEHCEQDNRPLTFKTKRDIVGRLRRYFGEVPLSSFTREKCEAFKTNRRREVGPAAVNRELTVLKHALRMAVEWDYLEASPATGVKRFKEPPGRVRYLTREEADALVAACQPSLRPVVLTALYTGMRLGEILALEWKDVDMERRQIRVANSKTNEARGIPINDVLYDILAAARMKKGKVFCSSRGGPYQSIRTAFLNAVQAAGLKDFTFHDLRHTFASWLAMEGVPTSTIGKLLGHKTPQMTMRYAHLAPEYLADVVGLLTQNKHKAVSGTGSSVVTH